MTARKPKKTRDKKPDLDQDTLFRASVLSQEAAEKLTTDIADADLQKLCHPPKDTQ